MQHQGEKSIYNKFLQHLEIMIEKYAAGVLWYCKGQVCVQTRMLRYLTA